ncbi:MAG TPA: PAS domain S-box protein [bacterium]|nr:PAS domain S-box protein [bacterium]
MPVRRNPKPKRTTPKPRRQDTILRALTESPTDTQILTLDRSYRYTSFNACHRQEMKKHHGVDIKRGMCPLSFMSVPQAREMMQWSMNRALAGESFTTVESRPGGVNWGEFDWNPVRTASGKVTGLTILVRNITRRKRVEAALAESELKYRSLFESSSDAIMLLTADKFFDCNPATLRVFGYSTREEFLGKHPADVSPPCQADGRDSRAAADEKIAIALREGRNHFEWLHQRADGSVFPADVLLTPMVFRGQRILQATVRDISDRKRTDAALADSEARYRRLVEDMGEGIGMTDIEERFSFANRAADELFGLPRGGLVGRKVLEFLDLKQADVVRQQTARRRNGETDTYNLDITRPDGTKRTTLVTASPQQDARGRFLGTFAIFRDVTERRQHRLQVEAERDRLRRILDAMPDGVYLVGQDCVIQYVNPALLSRAGPVNGRKCYEYLMGRPEPCPDCPNPKVLAGETTRREYTIPSGEITYDIQDVRVTGDDGRPARLVFLRDITERLRTETALRESESRFRQLANSLPQLVWTCAPDGPCDFLNEQWVEYTGIPAEPQLGFGWLEQLHPDDRGPTVAAWNAAVTSGSTFHVEFRIRRRDGEYRWFDTRAVRLSNAEGHTVKWFGTNTDITEHKLAELRERQHLDDTALLRDTAVGFIQLGRDADIYQYVADRLHRLIGKAYVIVNSYDEAADRFTVRAVAGIGARLETVLKVLGRNPIGTEFTLAQEHRPEYASEKLLRFEDGIRGLAYGQLRKGLARTIERTFDIGGTYAIGIHWRGRILGTLNFLMRRGAEVHDPEAVEAFVNQAAIAIQHRRDADELARHRDHLEELVHERTAELEAANRELEAFSYSASHDLRAPLRAIDGFTQALAEDAGPELNARARDDLFRVTAAARRMEGLIDNLLGLARIARMPIERKPVDMSQLARNIAAELRRAAPDRKVEFMIPDGLTALADRTLVSLALQNLLSNAWKFTSQHATARIEFGQTLADRERIWFVRDDGAGFDMAYVDKVFAPFQRLHTEREFPGSGIGLTIVQRIVGRHGGRVWIEGGVEKGTTCWFTLEPATADRGSMPEIRESALDTPKEG